jgi:tetratricopeptide (TPR) repeat protein
LLVLVVFTSARAIGQISAWSHLRTARALVTRYQDRDALGHLDACLQVWPRDPEALLLSARVARRTAAFDQANLLLDRYQAVRGEDDDLVLERLLVRAASGDLDAVARFGRMVVDQHDPAAPLVLEAFVHGYLRMYRLQEADACLQAWLQLQPDNAQAHFLQGLMLEQRGALQEALASFRQAVALDAHHDQARLHLSFILTQLHQGGEALPHLQYLQRRGMDSPMLPVYLARCHYQLGQTDDAERVLHAALEQQPHFAPALADLGKILFETGRRQEAGPFLKEAASLLPGDYQVHYLYSQSLAETGNQAEVKAEAARLKQIEEDVKRVEVLVNVDMSKRPHDPALHYEAGMLALRAGAPEDGLRWLESALKEDPDYGPAHLALAYFYQQNGDASRAARHLQQARKSMPQAPSTGPTQSAERKVSR